MRETAVITRIEGDHLILRITRQSGCSACSAKSACFTGDAETSEFTVENDGLPHQPGDPVAIEIGMPPISASALAYLPPMLGLLSGAVIGGRIGDGGDLGAALGALAGLVLGFAVTGIWSRRLERRGRFTVRLAGAPEARPPLRENG